MIPFITAYGPKDHRPKLDCSNDKGQTKQSFKDECDINVIMKRYEKTGILPDYGGREGRFLDCTGVDFNNAMQTIAQARSLFAELPAALRARFDNDPAKMLDFVHDDANYAEAIELGLLKEGAKAPTDAPSASNEPVTSSTGTTTSASPATS